MGGGRGGVRENWERDRGGSVLLVTCYWVTMFEGSQLTLTFFDNKHDLDRLLKVTSIPPFLSSLSPCCLVTVAIVTTKQGLSGHSGLLFPGRYWIVSS